MNEALKPEHLNKELAAIEELENTLVERREAVQGTLHNILYEAGLLGFDEDEIIKHTWKTPAGDLIIDTQLPDLEPNHYRIPACIIDAEDPLAAAKAYRLQKDEEEIEARAKSVKAQIAYLESTLAVLKASQEGQQ